MTWWTAIGASGRQDQAVKTTGNALRDAPALAAMTWSSAIGASRRQDQAVKATGNGLLDLARLDAGSA